jgi:hypothetical protein
LGGVQSLTIVKLDSALALVSADFCLQKLRNAPANVCGQGLANAHTVDALIAETSAVKARHSDVGIIWIVHFPPLLDVERGLRLRFAQRVLDAAKVSKVRTIIAGHLHRNQLNYYGDIEMICTGSVASHFREMY